MYICNRYVSIITKYNLLTFANEFTGALGLSPMGIGSTSIGIWVHHGNYLMRTQTSINMDLTKFEFERIELTNWSIIWLIFSEVTSISTSLSNILNRHNIGLSTLLEAPVLIVPKSFILKILDRKTAKRSSVSLTLEHYFGSNQKAYRVSLSFTWKFFTTSLKFLVSLTKSWIYTNPQRSKKSSNSSTCLTESLGPLCEA